MRSTALGPILAVMVVSSVGLDPAAYGNPSGQLRIKVRTNRVSPKLLAIL